MFGWIAAAVVAATMALTGGSSAPDWEKVYRKVAPSLVPIYSSPHYAEGSGVYRSCSSVVVEGGILLTARHCVDRNPRYYVESSEPIDGTFPRLGELVALPIEEGLYPALPIATGLPKPGSDLAAIGFGWGADTPTITIGLVQGVIPVFDEGSTQFREDRPFFWHTASTLKGQSGGAIVNKDGELVTIVWFDWPSIDPSELVSGSPLPHNVQVFVRSVQKHGFDFGGPTITITPRYTPHVWIPRVFPRWPLGEEPQ